jgi:hypothetical protein
MILLLETRGADRHPLATLVQKCVGGGGREDIEGQTDGLKEIACASINWTFFFSLPSFLPLG